MLLKLLLEGLQALCLVSEDRVQRLEQAILASGEHGILILLVVKSARLLVEVNA